MNLQPGQCSAGTALLHPAQLHSDWICLFISNTWSLPYGSFKVARFFAGGLEASQASVPGERARGELCCLSQMALLQKPRSLTSATFC